MGASAILALCHDALIVVGSYAVLRIPLSNSFIAAILTVLGYSINATIVIFDRIRENRTKLGRNNYSALVDTSVKQTMTRSLYYAFTFLVYSQLENSYYLLLLVSFVVLILLSLFQVISGTLFLMLQARKRLQLMLSQQRLRSNLQF